MTEGVAGEPGPARREAEDRFLACWDEVAALWGVSPAHARIHGLLFLARRPVDAESIERRLGISHGSCSTGLTELIAWGVVRRVNVPGSRRAKFATDPDGWKWFRHCARERKRRDVDPLLVRLREAERAAAAAAAAAREARAPDRKEIEEARERMAAFVRFLEEFEGVVDAFLAMGGGPPARMLRAFSRAAAKARGGQAPPKR